MAAHRRDHRRGTAGAGGRNIVRGLGPVSLSLWRLEVTNSLQTAVRHGRISADVRDSSLADLDSMKITTDPHTDEYAWTATLRLADRFRLTAYDAAYLELAHRRSLPLVSLHRDLRAAADRLGIALLGE